MNESDNSPEQSSRPLVPSGQLLGGELERLNVAWHGSLASELRAAGIALPAGDNEATAMYRLGRAGLPEEVGEMAGFDEAPYADQIRAMLDKSLSQGDLIVVHRLAQIWAGNVERGTLNLRLSPSVEVSQEGIIMHSRDTNGNDIVSKYPGEGLTDFVVDYGSGLNGVASRIAEATALGERSLLLAANEFEAEVLRTLADLREVPSGQIEVLGGGIASDAPELAKKHAGKASLVIASRIHGAGDSTVMTGVNSANALLRSGGLFVLRGPENVRGRSYMKDMIGFARQNGLGRPVYDQKVEMLRGEKGQQVIFQKR